MDGSWLEWVLGVAFFTIYIFCIFTVCMITFQKGRWVLGIVGIFMPFLWLIGAILPPRRGSRYEAAQQSYYQQSATMAPPPPQPVRDTNVKLN
jgi:hypothetical protein